MQIHDTLIATPAGAFAVRDCGMGGRDVLLVHGTGHNLEVWHPLMEQLHRDLHLVAFDLRGHGQTPAASANAEDSWRDLAIIIAALGLQRPILVGHSSGGYAATAHAAAGGSCAGLVIVDGFVPDTRKVAMRAAGVIPQEQLWTLFRYGWVATDEEKEAWVKKTCMDAPEDWLNAGIAPDLVEAFTRRSFIRHADRWQRRPTLEEIARLGQFDVRRAIVPAVDVYVHLRVPATFVFATRGLYRERRTEVKGIAENIGARFVELDAGHNAHMQQPAALAAVVRDMVTATAAWPQS